MPRRDNRSPEAQAYRKLYNTAAWQKARHSYLAKEPLCCRCKAMDKIVPATVVNHIIPHKGNWELFIDSGNHQSMCKPCHDGPTQSQERTGFIKGSTPDGRPIDPNHPWNRP